FRPTKSRLVHARSVELYHSVGFPWFRAEVAPPTPGTRPFLAPSVPLWHERDASSVLAPSETVRGPGIASLESPLRRGPPGDRFPRRSSAGTIVPDRLATRESCTRWP